MFGTDRLNLFLHDRTQNDATFIAGLILNCYIIILG